MPGAARASWNRFARRQAAARRSPRSRSARAPGEETSQTLPATTAIAASGAGRDEDPARPSAFIGRRLQPERLRQVIRHQPAIGPAKAGGADAPPVFGSVRYAAIRVRRESAVHLQAVQEVERIVELLVVLRVRRNVGRASRSSRDAPSSPVRWPRRLASPRRHGQRRPDRCELRRQRLDRPRCPARCPGPGSSGPTACSSAPWSGAARHWRRAG